MVDFISGSILARATRTNSTITAPTGIVDGNPLVILFEIAAADPPGPPVPTPPLGFNLFAGGFPATNTDGAFISNLYAWGKVANGEAGDYTVLNASAITSAFMLNLTPGDLVDPFNIAASIGEGVGGTPTVGSITTLVDLSCVIWVANAWDLGSITPPSGATPTFVSRYDPADAVLHVATGVMSPAGATGSKTWVTPVPASPWSGALIPVSAAAAAGSNNGSSRIIMIHNGGNR